MNNDTLAQLLAKNDQLEREYRAQRNVLDKQIYEARKSQQAEVLAKIRLLMSEHDLRPDDLGVPKKIKKIKQGGSVAAKYLGPNGETWTGRGRQPKWLGENREQYRIKE